MHASLDLSNTGAGKTFIAAIIAMILNLKLLVFCPKNAVVAWNDLLKLSGQDGLIMTYGSIATKEGTQAQHNLLTKTTFTYKENPPKGSPDVPYVKTKNSAGHYTWQHYYPTRILQEILAAGVMVVFDEAHIFKNDNNNYQSAIAIGNELAKMGGRSRMLLMSATLVHSDEHMWALANFLGYFGPDRYHIKPNVKLLEPLWSTIPPTNERDALLSPTELSAARRKRYAKEPTDFVAYEILKPLCHVCPVSGVNDGNNIVSECYLTTNPLLFSKISHNITELRRTLRPPTTTGGAVQFGGAMTTYERLIELAKIPVFINQARKYIDQIPGAKIVIGVHFTESLELLYEIFHGLGLNPVAIDGRSSVDNRSAAIKTFNHGNARVIIMNVKAASMGISIHDTVGDAPRVLLANERFSLVDQVQFTGRIHRAGVKSDARSNFIHSKVTGEVVIPASVSRKSNQLRKLLPEDDPRVLPNDYLAQIDAEPQLGFTGLPRLQAINDKEQLNKAQEAGRLIKQGIMTFDDDDDDESEVHDTNPAEPAVSPATGDISGLY